MPNVLTHWLHSQEVAKGLVDGTLANAIAKHPRLFNLGSQGPDFLFYYNVYPWQNQKVNQKIYAIGGQVHKFHVNDFYEAALLQIKKAEPESRMAMIAYLAGHLCHWALDSTVHPFIFYRTNGFTKKTQYWHSRYESMLDTLMVTDVLNKPLSEYPTQRVLEHDEADIDAVADLYIPVLQQVFDTAVDQATIAYCFKEFHSVLHWLFSPKTVFFRFMQSLETVLGIKWKLTSHMVIGKPDHQHDIFNLLHNEWKNPSKPVIHSSASFLELYQLAINKGIEVLQLLQQALASGQLQGLLGFIDNRNYENGLSEFSEMIEFSSVY
ncbi:MAG: zinc dependent phospholipase C family protein [Erysipelotrichaceae bacterium]|jgi:hypothetical protein|nr:zinc dependent phospholipase C family protein [Erysipelotrichaceae bacterium]